MKKLCIFFVYKLSFTVSLFIMNTETTFNSVDVVSVNICGNNLSHTPDLNIQYTESHKWPQFTFTFMH